MPAQERRNRQVPGGDGPDEPTDVPRPDASRAQAAEADVDAVLDEIDEVLETNAEEFVRSFVQKGGQ